MTECRGAGGGGGVGGLEVTEEKDIGPEGEDEDIGGSGDIGEADLCWL